METKECQIIGISYLFFSLKIIYLKKRKKGTCNKTFQFGTQHFDIL